MRMRVSNLLIGTFLALVTIAPGNASAEDACACTAPIPTGSSPLGSLTSVTGNVLVTEDSGYVPAEVGAGLHAGSRVILGSESMATMQVGKGCTVPLSQNSSATLVIADQQLCVQVTTPQSAAATQTLVSPETTYGQADNERRRGFGVPEGIFGLAVASSILGAIFDEDDECPFAGLPAQDRPAPVAAACADVPPVSE
jgi:hypothetical protein